MYTCRGKKQKEIHLQVMTCELILRVILILIKLIFSPKFLQYTCIMFMIRKQSLYVNKRT